MLPVSLEEATIDESTTLFGEVEVGQRFIGDQGPKGVIFEKIGTREAMVISGESRGDVDYVNESWRVKKITETA